MHPFDEAFDLETELAKQRFERFRDALLCYGLDASEIGLMVDADSKLHVICANEIEGFLFAELPEINPLAALILGAVAIQVYYCDILAIRSIYEAALIENEQIVGLPLIDELESILGVTEDDFMPAMPAVAERKQAEKKGKDKQAQAKGGPQRFRSLNEIAQLTGLSIEELTNYCDESGITYGLNANDEIQLFAQDGAKLIRYARQKQAEQEAEMFMSGNALPTPAKAEKAAAKAPAKSTAKTASPSKPKIVTKKAPAKSTAKTKTTTAAKLANNGTATATAIAEPPTKEQEAPPEMEAASQETTTKAKPGRKRLTFQGFRPSLASYKAAAAAALEHLYPGNLQKQKEIAGKFADNDPSVNLLLVELIKQFPEDRHRVATKTMPQAFKEQIQILEGRIAKMRKK